LKSLISRPNTRAEAEFFGYDSVQMATKSPARRRALARIRGERASGRQTMGDVVVFGHGRTPVARNPGATSRRKRKFSTSQSLENSQNGERISISSGGTPRRPETCGARSAPLTVRGVSTRSNRRRQAPRGGGETGGEIFRLAKP